jgi:hypothetical protein
MKAMISFFATALFIGSIANAAIQIKCEIQSESEAGYSSRIVEMSLPQGHVTGIADVGTVLGREVSVEIGASAEGKPFVSAICAKDSGFGATICSQENSGLVIRESIESKATVTCKAQ